MACQFLKALVLQFIEHSTSWTTLVGCHMKVSVLLMITLSITILARYIITLVRCTIVYGIDNIPHNIYGYLWTFVDIIKISKISYGMMTVSHNIVMKLNNVMKHKLYYIRKTKHCHFPKVSSNMEPRKSHVVISHTRRLAHFNEVFLLHNFHIMSASSWYTFELLFHRLLN